MNKARLKNKRIIRHKFLVISVFILALITIKGTNKINRIINNYFCEIASIQATKISKTIINQAINNNILDNIDTERLFLVQKSEKGSIKSVDFNVKEQNKIMLLVNSNVTNYLKELEDGKSSIIDLKKSTVTNNFFSSKKGIFLEIPIGIIFNNIFLTNISPKIPVKLSLNGEMISRVKAEVESYGINNTLLKAFIEIEVNEQVILPKLSKNITIKNRIPIAIKMIQGDIPNYYLGNVTEKGSNY